MTQDEQDALLEILVKTLGDISANVERLSRLLVESQERRGVADELTAEAEKLAMYPPRKS